jgi:hypothetical protein
LAAATALSLDVLHHGRHGFRDVAADQHNHLCAGNVLQREGQAAINAECFERGGCG